MGLLFVGEPIKQKVDNTNRVTIPSKHRKLIKTIGTNVLYCVVDKSIARYYIPDVFEQLAQEYLSKEENDPKRLKFSSNYSYTFLGSNGRITLPKGLSGLEEILIVPNLTSLDLCDPENFKK